MSHLCNLDVESEPGVFSTFIYYEMVIILCFEMDSSGDPNLFTLSGMQESDFDRIYL